MAIFKPTVITKQGLELITNTLAQKQNITFTKIKIADVEENVNLKTLTDIENPTQIAEIEDIEKINNSTVKISATFNNQHLQQGYFMRTIGLFAKTEKGEVLYSVTTAKEADFIPPYNGKNIATFILDLITTVADTDNININIDNTACVTITKFNRKIEELEEKINNKANFTPYQLEENTDLNSLDLPVNAWVSCEHDHIWETIKNKPNNIAGSGIILNLSIRGAYRTQIYFPYHPNNFISYRMQYSNLKETPMWSQWQAILQNSTYLLEQDVLALEQDLRIMEIENTLKQNTNIKNSITEQNLNTNNNTYNLLLRIMQNNNFYCKNNANYTADKFLKIIDTYFINKKINKAQKDNLIELINKLNI